MIADLIIFEGLLEIENMDQNRDDRLYVNGPIIIVCPVRTVIFDMLQRFSLVIRFCDHEYK